MLRASPQDNGHAPLKRAAGDTQIQPEGYGILIEGIGKSYGAVKVLHHISLDIPPGSFVALLGPSGCGKTTLLRTIAGLEDANTGVIRIGGETVVDAGRGLFVPPQKRRLGMVFQSYALWPHMSVAQNILYPLRKQNVPRADWAGRLAEAVKAVGLPDILNRRPSQLSGGQQQRVALARAIVARPRVLLLDEPLSNLDANLRDQLRRELRRLHDAQGTTTILVTHDQEEAAIMADLVAVVNKGHIIQAGTPSDILDRPADRFTAQFVGYDNFFAATTQASDDTRVTLRLADGQTVALNHQGRRWAPARNVLVATRSTDLKFTAPDQTGKTALTGQLAHTQALGRWNERHIDVAGNTLVLRELAEANPGLADSSKVTLALPDDAPVLAA